MKAVFAIIASVLLAIAQGVSNADAASTPTPAKCACCDCSGKCCVTESAPEAPPAPATPTTPVSFKQFQPALVPAFCLPVASTFAAPKTARVFSSVPTLGGLPLYQRNCAYLI